MVYREGCGTSDIGFVIADYDVQNDSLSTDFSELLDRANSSSHPDIKWMETPYNGWLVSFDESETKTLAMFFDVNGLPTSSE